MNKKNLKDTLKSQSLSFADDVKKKMNYLMSDKVFMQYETGNADNLDDKLMSLFECNSNADRVSSFVTCDNQPDDIGLPSSVDLNLADAGKQQSFERKTMTPAERIAAMRGIKMPGDYLRKGSF